MHARRDSVRQLSSCICFICPCHLTIMQCSITSGIGQLENYIQGKAPVFYEEPCWYLVSEEGSFCIGTNILVMTFFRARDVVTECCPGLRVLSAKWVNAWIEGRVCSKGR